MEWIREYEIACLQLNMRLVSPVPGKKDSMIRKNLLRAFDLMDHVAGFPNSNVRLIVLPEYALNPIESGSLKDWLRVSVSIPGEYSDMIGKNFFTFLFKLSQSSF